MDLFENLSDNQIEAVKTIDEDLEIIDRKSTRLNSSHP